MAIFGDIKNIPFTDTIKSVANDLTGGALDAITNTSSVNKMTSSIKNRGITRPNRYNIILNIPPLVLRALKEKKLEVSSRQMSDLAIRCEATTLPGKNILTADVYTQGATRHMPYFVGFQDVTMTFILGDDMFEKKLFDIWQDTIIGPDTGLMNYYNDYQTNIVIQQMNIEDKVTYQANLIETFPVAVGEVNLVAGEHDTYSKLNVTFKYRRWESPESTKQEFPIILLPDKIKDKINDLEDKIAKVEDIENVFDSTLDRFDRIFD